jgi:hypothetical protein
MLDKGHMVTIQVMCNPSLATSDNFDLAIVMKYYVHLKGHLFIKTPL